MRASTNIPGLRPLATSYSIVALGEKDAEELASLEAACFSMAWSSERYREILNAVDKALLDSPPVWNALPAFMAFGMREQGGLLAAYITVGLHHAARELEIYNIAVTESRRKKGYGATLLKHILLAAQRGGMTRAVLEVRTGNMAAQALYASAGFLECGRRKGYYSDTGEDALVLDCDLSDAKGLGLFNQETLPCS